MRRTSKTCERYNLAERAMLISPSVELEHMSIERLFIGSLIRHRTPLAVVLGLK